MADKARSPQEVSAEILSRLDVAKEYQSLGLVLSGEPRESGMVAAFAFGREDRHPSAYCNVRTGIYGDSGGQSAGAHTSSLWDFAVRAGRFPDWQTARKAFAEKVGVTIGKESKSKAVDWREKLVLQPWSTPGNDMVVMGWCAAHKHGVTLEAIKSAGGTMAYWPCWVDKKTGERHQGREQVIAIPAYGQWLLDADPVAWQIWDSTGRMLESGKKGEKVPHKMLSVGPTSGALMGLSSLMMLCDPERRAKVELVWKVEGPADMLALWASLPPESRETVAVITNASGASGDVQPHEAKLLAGLRVAVVPDADKAGEVGAAKWVRALTGIAAEVRVVRLPWAVEDSHGRDVRDFINGEAVPA